MATFLRDETTLRTMFARFQLVCTTLRAEPARKFHHEQRFSCYSQESAQSFRGFALLCSMRSLLLLGLLVAVCGWNFPTSIVSTFHRIESHHSLHTPLDKSQVGAWRVLNLAQPHP